MPKKTPSYRLHKPSGRAVVTLSDDRTGQRRDVYLGEYGTPESRARYHRVLQQWETAGRRLGRQRQKRGITAKPDAETMTVKALIGLYWRYARTRYVKPDGSPTTTIGDLRVTLRRLRHEFGTAPVDEFGPVDLQALRSDLIADRLARKTITNRIAYIVAMFRWGVAQQYARPETLTALQAVRGLRAGEQGVREGRRIVPVPEAHIDAVLPHVPPVVADMIRLHRVTGMRSTELCLMRPVDIDTTGKVWLYRPTDHKTAHHGHERVVYLGPQAQAVVKPYLAGRAVDAYLFDPREAGGKVGANAVRKRYTRDTYHRAIVRGCDIANPPPPELARQRVEANGRKRTRLESVEAWKARLGPEGWAALQQWRRDHRWHPHQLRHNAATALRKEFGIEAARVILGHRSAAITEVYAEVDRATAINAALKLG